MQDDKGSVVHWAAELGSPSANTMNGWTRDAVMPGDVIIVYMHQVEGGHSCASSDQNR